jgi:hypothetical protein
LWWDTTNFQLNVYGGPTAGTPNNWVLIGPPTTTTTGTTSGAAVDTIKDKSGYDHVVIKFYISNNIVGIVSYSDAFTPQTELAGFALINPGLNLTTLLSSTFTGDATNALKLNGVSSSSFLRSDQNTSTSYKLNADGGIAVANEFDITLDATNNQIAVKSSINNRNLNFYVNQNGNLTAAISIGASTGIVTINDAQEVQGALTTYGAFIANTTTTLVGTTTLKNSLLPSNPGTIDIGSTDTRFGNVWATNLIGNVTGSLTAVTISASGNVTVSGTVTIGGSLAATQSYVATYVQTATQNSQGQKTISTSAPAGGSNGDIWYQI